MTNVLFALAGFAFGAAVGVLAAWYGDRGWYERVDRDLADLAANDGHLGRRLAAVEERACEGRVEKAVVTLVKPCVRYDEFGPDDWSN